MPDINGLKVFQGEQRSYRHDGKTPSRGHYAVAWLDHGIQPRDASYQVAILVRGADTTGRLARRPENYYRVVNQTNALHRVDFPAHRMSGLVFFEPIETDHPVIVGTSKPCLLMCRRMSDDRIRLSVANPDLGFLAPDAPPPTFRSISRNDNQYLTSQPRPVQIALRGNWRPVAPAENVAVVATKGQQTTVRFNGLNGMTVQADFASD